MRSFGCGRCGYESHDEPLACECPTCGALAVLVERHEAVPMAEDRERQIRLLKGIMEMTLPMLGKSPEEIENIMRSARFVTND